MYKENKNLAIDVIDKRANVWSIVLSPLEFAYENSMYDVVAHSCSQKSIKSKWYGLKPDERTSFYKVWDFFI